MALVDVFVLAMMEVDWTLLNNYKTKFQKKNPSILFDVIKNVKKNMTV